MACDPGIGSLPHEFLGTVPAESQTLKGFVLHDHAILTYAEGSFPVCCFQEFQ
jgi:hypothetical protein